MITAVLLLISFPALPASPRSHAAFNVYEAPVPPKEGRRIPEAPPAPLPGMGAGENPPFDAEEDLPSDPDGDMPMASRPAKPTRGR